MKLMQLNPTRLTLAALLATTLGACSMMPMAPAMTTLAAPLSAANEVPAGTSAGSGMAEAKLDAATRTLSWTINYRALSGPATAAHFHGPAMAGQNTGVALPMKGDLASPITGSAMLTEAQMADVMAGRWYFNIHTAANPGGEIRGQLTVRP